MNKIIKGLGCVALFCVAFGESQVVMAKDVNILDFGAVGDSTTLNTTKIQKAIDECAATGGGTVTVPPGIFLTGAINLRSNVELYLDRGGVLRGSLNIPEDYPHRALIYAEDIENAGISGQGIIDGYANNPYYKRFRVNDGKRPRGVFFNRCNNISVRNIQIINAGSWTLRLLQCDGVMIDGITINCLEQGNNDGIDCDARNVTIANCNINCDDDGICLKSDIKDFIVENITVTNCIVASNCNPIKLGTSSYGGFRNISISNCVVRPTTKSLIWDWSRDYDSVPEKVCTGLSGLTVQCVDGGTIENVSFSNITMSGVITPIFVCLNHRHGTEGSIRNIQFSNITATSYGIVPSLIYGAPDSKIEGVVLRDIMVEHEGGEADLKNDVPENLHGYPENRMYGRKIPAGGLYVRHADNVRVDNLQVTQRKKDYRPAVTIDDVSNFRLDGLFSNGIECSEGVRSVNSTNVQVKE